MSAAEPQSERDLLQLLGVTNADAPSAFDLLGVSEDCEDDQLIKQRVKARNGILKGWEQYRPNPAVQKMATRVMLQISKAGKQLKNPAARAAYRKSEGSRQAERFVQWLKPILAAGGEVDDQRFEQLMAEGVRQFRLDENEARRAIQEAILGENPFVALGIQRVAADETWPTAFDILMLEESELSPPDVSQRVAMQLTRIEDTERSGQVDAETALRLRTYVTEAKTTLASPDLTKAYAHQVRRQRAQRFRDMVEVAVRHSGQPDTSVLVQLVHHGRQMRLPQEQVEQILSQVAGVNITDAVGSDPVLSVSRSSIEAYVRGDGRGSKEIIGVRNDGTGQLVVRIETDCDWILISEPRFATRNRRDVSISIPAYRLRPGELHVGTIRISSDGGEAEIEVTAMLGDPGSEATLEDYGKASGAYFLGLGSILFLPVVILSWRFMMARKESPFRAFHCLQSMFLCLMTFLAFFITWIVMTAFGVGETPSEDPELSGICAPCCTLFLSLVVWIGVPIAFGLATREGSNIQIPGVAPLLRQLL